MKKLFKIGLLCLCFVSILPACASNQREANPEEVVNAFLEAFIADDIDGAMSYLTDDVVFNAINAQEKFSGNEDVRDYIDFLMRSVIDMETRNFSLDGNQVIWEASLERTSTPVEISYTATVDGGKISYLETSLIIK